MKIGNHTFHIDRHTYIMGILNVTPDSFSDGGKYNSSDKALKRTEEMIREGAHIIDVGGESTRPGYEQISDEAEIERTSVVIEKIKEEFDIPVSIDTYKSKVADYAVKAGADLVNDIWGLKYDPEMGKVIAGHGVACCLMHNRMKADYQDFLTELKHELKECTAIAHTAGIPSENIILDPGVGFGKTYEHNLLTVKHLKELQELGFPLLLGTSRKSVIGLTLDLPSDERIEGTLATTAFACMARCGFVRVHDVKENSRFIKMIEAIMHS